MAFVHDCQVVVDDEDGDDDDVEDDGNKDVGSDNLCINLS